jgi:hypothetical protein
MGITTADDSLGRNQLATPFVKPRTSTDMAQSMDPTSIYGLRRPNLEVELSASTPAQRGALAIVIMSG